MVNFILKEILFFNRNVSIVCQNINGPCPLIALVNAMLLRGDIWIDFSRSIVTVEQIVALLANRCLEIHSRAEVASSEHGQEQLNCILGVLPTLTRGMDINLRFESCDSFEYTKELCLFDIMRVPLKHGWVQDPQDIVEAHVVRNLSFNQAMNRLVQFQEVSATLSSDIPLDFQSDDVRQIISEGHILQTFLKLHSSQLTILGLEQILNTMSENEVAVMFRNNHFTTIARVGGQLFTLVTDEGYAKQPTVVWERLSEINGYGCC